MKENNNQDQLKEIQQLKQENDALKSLCNQKTAENESFSEKLNAMEWMLKPKQTASTDFVPDYGDLSDLNADGLIKKSIQKQQLQDIVSEYLDLLETSAAIYEKTGDYALGIFSSGWCRMMDAASRELCNTDDNRKALESGKWLCHDSCWKDASLKSMAEGKPVEVACNGGINLYAVPVRANNQIIGAINFGFGSPPKDDVELKKLSKKYKIPLADLRKYAKEYKDRPGFVIEYAKQRIQKSAQYLGYLVERRLEADSIEEIKERHRTTFHSIGDGVITTDKKGRITNMNPAAESYSGWTVKEAANRPLSEVFRIVNAKTRKTVADPVNKVLKSKKVIGLANHTVLISKSGKEYQIADTAAPIKNRNGEITGVVLVFSDVTREYSIREKLRQSEERLNFAMMVKNEGVWDWDLIKNTTFFDDRYYTMAGYAPNDFSQTFEGWAERVHPDDLEAAQAAITAYLGGASEKFDIEFRFRRKDGQWMWIQGKGKIIERDAEGKPTRMIGTHTDITERKLAEIEIQKSKEQLLTILNGINAFVYLADMETHELLFVNEAGLKIWGRNIIGQKCHKALQGFDQPCSFCTNNKIVDAKGQPSGVYEWEFQNSVNNRWYAIRDSAIRWEDGRLVRLEVAIDVTEQKLAQQKINESEERFQKMLALIPDMISIHDKDFNIVYCNWKGFAAVDEAKRVLYTKCYTTLRDMDEICPDCRAKEVIKTKKAFQAEAELPDGSWIDLRVIPVLDDHGEVELFVEWVRDITDQKQTLKRQQILYQVANAMVINFNLRELIIEVEKHLSGLIDTSNFYIALYDEDTGMLSAPFEKDEKDQVDTWPAAGSATGLVLNKKQSLLLKKQDILQMIESGKISQTGSICEAWLGVPIVSDDKVVGAIVVQSYDNADAFDESSIEVLEYVSNQIYLALERTKVFDDLVKAKNNAEESQARFIALHNASFGGILIHDKGKIIDCNQGLSDISGFSKEELMGMDGLKLFAEGSREMAIHNIQTGFEKPYEAKGVRKNGEEYDVRIQARNIPYKGRHVRAAEFRDITEDKRRQKELVLAKEKAQESDRLKSAFLANMSHEIRTPMNGILGFSELLKEPQLTNEQQQTYIEIIEKSGERMLNIINDIVDISRIESGLMDVTLKESNINEQLDYIYTFFKPQIEAKGMQLILSNLPPEEAAVTVTDREKLYAVLTNLVKNAIKYSHKGTIELGCNIIDTHGRAYLQFFVQDTGIGIPKDRQHAIFERFVQADIEDREARQGAGLGLAISKAYVKMLGGEIWVESEEGKGSAFYFTIPYKKELHADDKEKTNESGAIVRDKEISLKILIVEDDEMSSLVLMKYLKPFSKKILQAFNGEEAVDICRKHPDIDLIMMDVKMPVMDGDDAAREIRQFNKDVIIIAQTAKALAGDREKVMEAGFNDYVTKPIKKAELLQGIKQHIQRVE